MFVVKKVSDLYFVQRQIGGPFYRAYFYTRAKQLIPPRKFVSASMRHTHILRVIIQLCNAHNYARDYFLRMDKDESHNFHQFGNERAMKPRADWPLNVLTLCTKPNLMDACLFGLKTCLQSN